MNSKTVKIGRVTLNCMKPEDRDCLDRAMAEWKAHKKQLPKKIGDKRYVPGIYGFAYWLIRWSGLVQPTDKRKEVKHE